MLTCKPVSSRTSRSAVCSRVSPPSGVPFGSPHTTPFGGASNPHTTISAAPHPRSRTTTPPEDSSSITPAPYRLNAANNRLDCAMPPQRIASAKPTLTHAAA